MVDNTFSISAESLTSLARSSAATTVVVTTFGNSLPKTCPNPALHSDITGLVLQTTGRWKNSDTGKLELHFLLIHVNDRDAVSAGLI